jgi:hypothetical protein
MHSFLLCCSFELDRTNPFLVSAMSDRRTSIASMPASAFDYEVTTSFFFASNVADNRTGCADLGERGEPNICNY